MPDDHAQLYDEVCRHARRTALLRTSGNTYVTNLLKLALPVPHIAFSDSCGEIKLPLQLDQLLRR